MRLKKACENEKIVLSEINEAYLDFELLEDNGVDCTITQSTFTDINRDIFDRIMKIVKETLVGSSLSIETIDDILLVGGSSRIPEIRRLIRSEFTGVRICENINPEEAVVRGCSILASSICKGDGEKHYTKLVDKDNNIISSSNDPDPCPGNSEPVVMDKQFPSYNFIIKDVITHNIITLVVDEKGGERVYVLINKNRRIPCEYDDFVVLAEENQTEIYFNYSEFDSDDVDEFKRNKVKITKKIRPMINNQTKYIFLKNIYNKKID